MEVEGSIDRQRRDIKRHDNKERETGIKKQIGNEERRISPERVKGYNSYENGMEERW